MTTAERQSQLDALDAKIAPLKAELATYQAERDRIAAIVPVDPMTPYFLINGAKHALGDISLPLDPTDHKTRGVAIAVDSPTALSMHLSRTGWDPGAKTMPSVNGVVAYPNNFSATKYTLVIGTQTWTFTVSAQASAPPPPGATPAPAPPNPGAAPAPAPPVPGAATTPAPARPNPTKDYPVAFPYSPLAQDANGNSMIALSSGAKYFYVSPHGDDKNNGDQATPLRTLAKAMSLIRSGYPDEIWLERGGDYSTGAPIQWKASGRSPTEPMIVAAFGVGPRPVIDRIYTVASQSISNVAFIGLRIYAKARDWTAKGFNLANVKDGEYGFEWAAAGSGNLIEDCQINFWWYNIYLHGGQFTIRRNVIDHAWTHSGDKAQGMYISGGALKSNGPAHTIEDNIIYHNGWCPLVNGQPPKGNATGVWMFSHGIYCSQETGPILYRGNIVACNANNGINGRSGGVLEDNLFIDNSTAGYVGRNQRAADKDKEVWMKNNVAVNCNHGNGFGLETPFWSAGRVDGNIIAHHGPNCSDGYAIFIDPARTDPYITGDPVEFPTSSLISLSHNVFYNGGFIKVWANGASMTIHASGNVCNDPAGVVYQGGTSPKPDLAKGAGWSDKDSLAADPSRDAAKYNATLGGAADANEFAAKCASFDRTNYDPRYTAGAANAWIRGGY